MDVAIIKLSTNIRALPQCNVELVLAVTRLFAKISTGTARLYRALLAAVALALFYLETRRARTRMARCFTAMLTAIKGLSTYIRT